MSKIRINIFYVRHGKTPSNELEKKLSTEKLKHYFIKYDSELTETGKKESIKKGKQTIKLLKDNKIDIDFFGCSTLLRTMETCYLMFHDILNKKSIHPLPHIKESLNILRKFKMEKWMPYGDIPLPTIEEQKSKMEEKYGKQASDYINFKYIDNKNRCSSNYEKFKELVLPIVIENLILKEPSKETINMIIVTHSMFMKQQLKCMQYDGSKAENNQMYQVEYTYDTETREIKRLSECGIIH